MQVLTIDFFTKNVTEQNQFDSQKRFKSISVLFDNNIAWPKTC